MAERFMVDDAGTLIDMQTRDTFDYVSDVCSLLNELHEKNKELQRKNGAMEEEIECLSEEKEQLKYHLDRTEKELQEYKDFMSLG